MLEVVVFGSACAIPWLLALKEAHNILEGPVHLVKVEVREYHGDYCPDLIQDALRVFHIHPERELNSCYSHSLNKLKASEGSKAGDK
jgi:hypothetical protein